MKPTVPVTSYPPRQTDVKVLDDFFAQEMESFRKFISEFFLNVIN